MPEGDTLHKLAARVRPGLLGQTVVEVRERDRGVAAALTSKAITEVSALGKNLLIAVEPKWIVRIHLGLHGRARVWHPSTDWRRKGYAATLILATPTLVLATFRTMHARIHRRDDPALERALAKLGPDLLAPTIAIETVVARARGPAYAHQSIAILLLDQRVAAGIGNVYRSEVLFLERVHPRTEVGAVGNAALSSIYERARALMLSNLETAGRASVGPRRGARRQPGTPKFFAYRRRGLPCLRCRTPIERAVIGDQARSVYWCPHCQPAPTPPAPGT